MIAVEEYTATLKGKDGISAAKPDTRRKATKAITDFKEYLSQFDKTIPDESDIEAYRVKSEATDASKGYQATRTKITYIRGYFALNEERSKEATMTDETMRAPETLGAVKPETVQASEKTETEITAPIEPESLPEPVKVKTKKRGVKRIQVSVYLEPETYEGIRLMSANMNQTISDILEAFAENFVELNQGAIQRMKSAWSEIKVRFK